MRMPAALETICVGICCATLQPIAAREPYNRYAQIANSKVEEPAKGSVPDSHVLQASSICCIAQVSLSPGRIVVMPTTAE
jgi:hypothetical protein